jgi:mannose-6-phosphate isomerase-like protein (cupin superfamily)
MGTFGNFGRKNRKTMNLNKINLRNKFNLFQEQWTPKIVAELNGQQVKLAKVQGNFVWHAHENEDELFYIVKGELLLQFRDREVHLEEGEMLVVPRGVEHRPVAEKECWILLFEPSETKHTGEVESVLTKNDQDWI